ncbi:MAG: hypothetical protein L7U83_04480 [Akkermansiaceae bacterium]|nr:hypothetical protein [Akkermansiaceae bacterium]
MVTSLVTLLVSLLFRLWNTASFAVPDHCNAGDTPVRVNPVYFGGSITTF